jgi:hypothetical protein
MDEEAADHVARPLFRSVRMRPFFPMLLAIIMIPAALASCASGGGERSGSSPDLISAEDLEGMSVSSAYEAIRRLRPRWLTTRGTQSIQDSSAGQPVVFVDDIRFGDTSSLQSMRISDIVSIRYINARDATTRFGTGYSGGIISVSMKR